MTKTGYLALVAVAALALYGCAGKTKTGAATTTEKTAASTKTGDAHGHDHDHDHGTAAKKEGSALGEVAKDVTSSAKDAAATFANPTAGKCPVSGEPVDESVSFTLEGKTYGFCCKDCVDQFKENPAKFLTAK